MPKRSLAPSVPDPSRYLRAAELLEERSITMSIGCCWALCAASEETREDGGTTEHYIQWLSRVLEPKGAYSSWWYTIDVKGAPSDDQSIRHARIIGLCLCAILAAEGFVP